MLKLFAIFTNIILILILILKLQKKTVSLNNFNAKINILDLSK